VARQTAEAQGHKYKLHFDQNAVPHKFQIGHKVWLSDTTALGKNPKLTQKWIGPYKIIAINDNNAKIETNLINSKSLMFQDLKHFKRNLKNVFLKMINVFFKTINVFFKTLHKMLLKGK
jgi:hypothetical protein